MATTITTKGILYINDKQVENSFKNISRITRKLRGELTKLPVGTEKWIKKAEEVKRAEARFAKVKNEIYGIRKQLNKTGNVFTRLLDKVGGFGGVSFFAGTFIGTKRIVDDLLEVSDAITNVEKTTGLATEQVNQLWHEFSELNTRTSKMELMKIAEIGGRLGIQDKEQLKQFTEEIDKAYIALGDSFEGGLSAVTTQLGKMKNIFAETKDLDYGTAINQIGSALNELAAQGTSSESNISDFALRVGQLPEALKPSAAAILGMGAAFEESGSDARIAASGYSRFIISAASNIEKFAYSMNMGVEEAKKLLNTKPEQFFIRFSQGMKGLDSTETANIFKALKINTLEVQKAVGAAGKNAERFQEMINLSAKSMDEAVSLSKEFNKKNNNDAAVWKKITKGLRDFVTDGIVPDFFHLITKILGYITGVTSEAGDGIKKFRSRLNFLLKTVLVTTISFVSLKAAIFLTTKVSRAGTVQMSLYRRALSSNMFAARMLKGVLLLLSFTYAKVTGNTRRATAAMRLFGMVTKTTPIGFIVGLLTTAASAFYIFRDSTKDATDELNKQEKALTGVKKAQADIAKEVKNSASKLKKEVDPLIELIKNSNATLDVRKKAYEALVKIHPDFKGTLDDEYKATDKLALVYGRLAEQIKQAAIARGLKGSLESAADELAKAQVAEYEALLKKQKEDEKNRENKAYNKSIEQDYSDVTDNLSFRSGGMAHLGAWLNKKISLKTDDTSASEAYDKAVQERIQKEEHLAAVKGFYDKQRNEYLEKQKALESQIMAQMSSLKKASTDKEKAVIEQKIEELKAEKRRYENVLSVLMNFNPSDSNSNNKDDGGDGDGKKDKHPIEKPVHPLIKKSWENISNKPQNELDNMLSELERRLTDVNKVKEDLKKGWELDDWKDMNLFGFNLEQWDEMLNNLDTMEGKIQGVGAAFIAMGNMANLYAQHQKNLLDKEWKDFDKTQQKKKKSLERQLDRGEISQKQYQNALKKMEEESQNKREELAKKQHKAEKVGRIFSIIGNTAVAVSKALTAGPVAGPILAGVVGALGLGQLAIVQGQEVPGYEKGGYTKGLGFADENGLELAGAVHAHEYVIPEWLLKTPEVARAADWIESKRTGKEMTFNQGGATTPTPEMEINTVGEEDPANLHDIYIILLTILQRIDSWDNKQIEAYMVSDAKNGRLIKTALKEYERIENKNKR